ncbi:rhodanese-like domain-containing protein [Lujinxingia litoralis]|uniref:Rhodanese-like domain-containing protein n=1 Tax=Lujinxingia litoralis TaxID=2211119 RepID=A0A328C9G7_9DELT|nr:rhodanese-like domain-containing protein [Lujinxingia litoralis]RAL22273.1 rhodanese-like domain-containing protein [Lujinxingia litoralis]
MTSNLMTFALIALVILVALPIVRSRMNFIDPQEARQLVEEGALLLDVRTPAEFNERHIPGALNIPLQELQARQGELPEQARPIVVYCRSGNRSSQARNYLRSQGFEQVHDLGPLTRWP